MNLLPIVGIGVVLVLLSRPTKPCPKRATAGTDAATGALTEERIILPPARETGLSNLRLEIKEVTTQAFDQVRHMLHLDACDTQDSHPGVSLAQQSVQA